MPLPWPQRPGPPAAWIPLPLLQVPAHTLHSCLRPFLADTGLLCYPCMSVCTYPDILGEASLTLSYSQDHSGVSSLPRSPLPFRPCFLFLHSMPPAPDSPSHPGPSETFRVLQSTSENTTWSNSKNLLPRTRQGLERVLTS